MTNWLLIAVLILTVGCVLAGLGWLWSAAQEERARERARAWDEAHEAWDQARRQYVEDLRKHVKQQGG